MAETDLGLFTTDAALLVRYGSTQRGSLPTQLRLVVCGPRAHVCDTELGAANDTRPGVFVQQYDKVTYGPGGSALKFFVLERVRIVEQATSVYFRRVSGIDTELRSIDWVQSVYIVWYRVCT